jgi:hypothetical protein
MAGCCRQTAQRGAYSEFESSLPSLLIALSGIMVVRQAGGCLLPR